MPRGSRNIAFYFEDRGVKVGARAGGSDGGGVLHLLGRDLNVIVRRGAWQCWGGLFLFCFQRVAKGLDSALGLNLTFSNSTQKLIQLGQIKVSFGYIFIILANYFSPLIFSSKKR